jgi:hypothetical protein
MRTVGYVLDAPLGPRNWFDSSYLQLSVGGDEEDQTFGTEEEAMADDSRSH